MYNLGEIYSKGCLYEHYRLSRFCSFTSGSISDFSASLSPSALMSTLAAVTFLLPWSVKELSTLVACLSFFYCLERLNLDKTVRTMAMQVSDKTMVSPNLL